MSFYETYSQRQQKLTRSTQSDVYQYDDLPIAFRHQVIRILLTHFGQRTQESRIHPSDDNWIAVLKIYARATGDPIDQKHYPYQKFSDFFLKATDSEALDMIEIA